MKKILLAIALMTGTAALFAGTHTHSTGVAAEKNISATIRSQIRFPEFLLDKQGEHAAAIFLKSPHLALSKSRLYRAMTKR